MVGSDGDGFAVVSVWGATRAVSSVASDGRAASSVVGVVLLVGLTVTLAAAGGAVLAFGSALDEPPPRAAFEASLDATDGWPDGQLLRLVHESGEPVPVEAVALVVELDRTGARARLSGFPTRRLTGENVRGSDVFDSGYAGVDGALDAAHTDGEWTSGESASVRIAQGDLDVRPGDQARITVVYTRTNAILGRIEVTAEED
jgi:FlaG/FlaF family flagellin (archaellin)